jgi:hypothetical protein
MNDELQSTTIIGSTHLRHCPKHRKPNPCPHCALAVAAIAAQAPAKCGRPYVHGSPMTAAERMAAMRERRRQEKQNDERRKIIAELMKIYRRKQSVIIEGTDSDKYAERITTASQHRREYRDGLDQMKLPDLQMLLETETETPDTRGRLHNERSGEQKRGEQSEIEHIHAARQHDSSLPSFSTEQDLLREPGTHNPQLSAGFRATPEGAGPTSFEQDDPHDDPDVRTGAAKPEYKPQPGEKTLNKRIEKIIGQMRRDPETGRAKCPVCDETFLVEQGARNHLHEQYCRGKRDLEKFERLAWSTALFNEKSSLRHSIREPDSVAYRHYEFTRETRGSRNFVTARFVEPETAQP